MSNNWRDRNCLYVTGFPPDVERRALQNEFLKFGQINKLYLDKFGNFAKVFYAEKESCDLAVQGLNNTSQNWRVQYFDNTIHSTPLPSSSSVSSSEAANMAGYNDYYDEDDFMENFDYCNIHGQPLVVLQADSGDLYVNLKDIRKTGFALFRRENFSSVLVDKKQISKEFELYLLSEAQNYILKNRVASIDEDQILKTIERCKNKLLGGNVNHETRNNFGPGRTVQPMGSSKFVITSDVQYSTPNSKYPVNQTVSQRPPKSLSNSFGPNHSNHSVGSTQKRQEHKANQSGFGREIHNNVDVENPRENQRERNHAFSKPSSSQRGKNSEFVKSTANHREKNDYQITRTNQRTSNLNDSSSSESAGSRKFANKRINKKFEVGETYAVHVAYAEKEKDNICWIQDQNDIKAIEELFLQINEIEGDLETLDPVAGQCVMALYEGVWNRARVMTADPLKVHFLDYGNKSEVEMVKSLPDELKKIPEFAVRAAVNKSNNLNLNEQTELTIKIKQQYEDGTYLVDAVEDNNDKRKVNMVIKASESIESLEPPSEPVVSPKETPIEKAYFNVPKPMADLNDGDKVMIIAVEGDKFLVKTKQCAQKSKEITEYIKELDKSALVLSNVKVGQIVLCSKDGLTGLYRALVTKKDSAAVVTVKYLDFSGEDDLSVKSLRNIDNYLATVPLSILLTPKIEGLDINDEKILEYVVNLCNNREKCTVVYEGNFDLKFPDGTLISEKLNEIKNPKLKEATVKSPVQEEVKLTVQKEAKSPVQEEAKPPVQDAKPPVVEKESAVTKSRAKLGKNELVSSTSTASNKVLYDEMDWVNIESGTHTCVCYSIQDVDNVTMIFSSEEVIEHLSTITSFVNTDETPYKPEEFEMCFVSFKGPDEEEASWYRAAVLEVDGDDYYVTFVDFGNQETIKSKDIRQFPASLKNIPILGTNCECSGIPNLPKILARLKELIPEGEEVEVVVKELKDLKYLIEIPDIYKKLKSEGLF